MLYKKFAQMPKVKNGHAADPSTTYGDIIPLDPQSSQWASANSAPSVWQYKRNEAFCPPPESSNLFPRNPLNLLEQENHAIRVLKESKKNREEREHLNNINIARNQLSAYVPISLNMKVIPSNESVFFPDSMRQAVQDITSITGLDAIGNCIQILGGISIATWGRVAVRLDANWSEPTVSMILQVAEAGSRKSAAVSILRRPFDDFSSSKNEGRKEEIQFSVKQAKLIEKEFTKSISRKIASIAKSGVTPESIECAIMISEKPMKDIETYLIPLQKASLFQILIDNATPTAFAKVLSEQGECQGCITAEPIMIQNLLDKKVDYQLFNRLHTQEAYEKVSVRNISLKHPAFPMINLVQPSIAIDFYKNATLNDLGVTARFVPYFHNGNNATNNTMLSNDSIKVYNQTITRLLNEYHTQDANAERFEVGVEVEAYHLIKDFEREIDHSVIPNMPSSAEPCLRKLHGQAARFAWCIHAWNHDKPHCSAITAEEMSQAIALCHYSLPHIRYVYDSCGLESFKNAIKVIECLQRINTNLGDEKLWNEGITSRTIQQRSDIKVKEVDNALQLLEQHNALRIIDNGARNLTVVLHPNFFNFQWY